MMMLLSPESQLLFFFLIIYSLSLVVNYSKMKKGASAQYCPVVSFLGPTGGGKSSLICKFQPNKYVDITATTTTTITITINN